MSGGSSSSGSSSDKGRRRDRFKAERSRDGDRKEASGASRESRDRKRRRSKERRSPVRRRRGSPEGRRSPEDVHTKVEREKVGAKDPTQDAPAKRASKLEPRTGGVYIPPWKLAQMQKEIVDKNSEAYQRMAWESLKKSINGNINKVNIPNIKNIIPELFGENLDRGRGLLCRSIMKAQAASLKFSNIYAALIAVINTKLPEIGELLLKRLIGQFLKSFKRNDKKGCVSSAIFVAHLVNQQVAPELLALEILVLLLENPNDDSVEIAVQFVKECGYTIQELAPKPFDHVFERFRAILHEGTIDQRVQFTIENLFAVRKASFAEYPGILPELDLVEADDQITHMDMSLEAEDLDPEEHLNVFNFDPEYQKNEQIYDEKKKEILGEDSDSDEDSDDDSDEDSEGDIAGEIQQQLIQDETEQNLVNLRRTIYLTIMSAVSYEECAHKLLKIKFKEGQEGELCNMLIECCAQRRTYHRYYGLLGERFCFLSKEYADKFEECFLEQYNTIHRLETNKLRNVSKFFAHLLHSDALGWQVLRFIRLTENDTTSSTRIFIKYLFQELSEHLGLVKLNARLHDPFMAEHFQGIFPKDTPKNSRFAVNFFTSIGLGGITDDLRLHLKNAPKMIMAQPVPGMSSDSDSSSDSSSSDSSSDSSDSDSSSDSSSDSGSESGRDGKRKLTDAANGDAASKRRSSERHVSDEAHRRSGRGNRESGDRRGGNEEGRRRGEDREGDNERGERNKRDGERRRREREGSSHRSKHDRGDRANDRDSRKRRMSHRDRDRSESRERTRKKQKV